MFAAASVQLSNGSPYGMMIVISEDQSSRLLLDSDDVLEAKFSLKSNVDIHCVGGSGGWIASLVSMAARARVQVDSFIVVGGERCDCGQHVRRKHRVRMKCQVLVLSMDVP